VGWVGERSEPGDEQPARLQLYDRCRLRLLSAVDIVQLVAVVRWSLRVDRPGRPGRIGRIGRLDRVRGGGVRRRDAALQGDKRRRQDGLGVLDDCSFALPLEPAQVPPEVGRERTGVHRGRQLRVEGIAGLR
jgi:hypothetical protein